MGINYGIYDYEIQELYDTKSYVSHDLYDTKVCAAHNLHNLYTVWIDGIGHG